MSRRNLNGRRRNNEEEYFHRLDLELLDQMRKRAIEAEDRSRLAKSSTITDDAILEALAQVGVSHTNAMLLHFVPLVEVAWRDGSVSCAERDLITAVARFRGIIEGDTADCQLSRWLNQRPSPDVLQAAVRALRAIVQSLPAVESEVFAHSLLKDCVDVAAASGGFLGFSSSVSSVERLLIEELARQLTLNQAAVARSAG
jgi:hypothetical protein